MSNVIQILIQSAPFMLTAVVVSVVFSLLLINRIINKLNRHHAMQMKQLEDRLSILTSSSLGMGKKIIAMEERMQSTQKTLGEMRRSDQDFSYSQAQKLIAEGLDEKAIAANSGLSDTEIHLMQMLHQQKSGGMAESYV